jgi:hypothetical protein
MTKCMAYIRTFCQQQPHTTHKNPLSRDACPLRLRGQGRRWIILGKEPRDESRGRGGATIDPRGTAIVVAVAIDTTAVAGIGKGVRIVHPPAAIDRRPPPPPPVGMRARRGRRRRNKRTTTTTKTTTTTTDKEGSGGGGGIA